MLWIEGAHPKDTLKERDQDDAYLENCRYGDGPDERFIAPKAYRKHRPPIASTIQCVYQLSQYHDRERQRTRPFQAKVHTI